MNINNSVVKNRIREYIFDNISFNGYNDVSNAVYISEYAMIRECYRIFMDEVGRNRVKRNGGNRMEAFEYWLRGLCSVLSVEFYTYKQARLLAKWTEDERWTTEWYDKVDNKFWYLIAREFWAMYDKIGG